jgi:predicted hotdog family 3-hydroxylacyl-ACP dehydratase
MYSNHSRTSFWPCTAAPQCMLRVKSDIVSYDDFLAPCFPIVEESSVRIKLKNKEQLPESFLINLYAYTLSYWDFSQTLALYTRPDQDNA